MSHFRNSLVGVNLGALHTTDSHLTPSARR
jgi:hypothetical protein